jgi:hypothetical protein
LKQSLNIIVDINCDINGDINASFQKTLDAAYSGGSEGFHTLSGS